MLGALDHPREEQAFLEYLDRPLWRRFFSNCHVRRLKDISHYGLYWLFAQDGVPEVREASRLEHSIGVASLCYRYAGHRRIEGRERDALLAASLLHDVAHFPFSHSLESLFVRRNGWDHNAAAPVIASRVLDESGADSHTTGLALQILARKHPLSDVLFGQTGADSVENLERTLQWAPSNFKVSPGYFLEAFPHFSRADEQLLTETKTSVYREIFYDPHLQLFERTAQALVWQGLKRGQPCWQLRDSPLDMGECEILNSGFSERLGLCARLLRGVRIRTRPDPSCVDSRELVNSLFTLQLPQREIRMAAPGQKKKFNDRKWTTQVWVKLGEVLETLHLDSDSLSSAGILRARPHATTDPSRV